MSYLGIDVGTTGCKAVAFDAEGNERASAYREYRTLVPQAGWTELDSDEVCAACMDAIRQAAETCRLAGDPVRGLGVTSQGEAFTPLDRQGHALAHAMVSSDSRAAAITESFAQDLGRKALYEITGHTAHPMFTLFKLLWLRRNRPDVWKRAARFLCFEDLLHQRLGVDPAIAWPLAGRTMLFDIHAHVWSSDILAAVGVEQTQLARPLPSGTVVGTVPERIAEELALARGTVVVTGGHDQPCGALGSGVTTAGRAMYATGTVDCITPSFSAPIQSEELYRSNLCTYDHAMPGMYTTVAFNLTGGNLLKWFRDEWGQREVEQAARTGSSAYELLLQQMDSHPSGLLVLPHFNPTGTPYFDTESTGAIIGLRVTTHRGEVLRALLEGLAYEMRLNLDIMVRSGIQIHELRAIGGGARSPIWNQLKADVLGKPITTVAVTEAGCLGVAMLVRAAQSGERLDDIVARWVKTGPVLEPDRKNAAYYGDRFAVYQRLYPALRALRSATSA